MVLPSLAELLGNESIILRAGARVRHSLLGIVRFCAFNRWLISICATHVVIRELLAVHLLIASASCGVVILVILVSLRCTHHECIGGVCTNAVVLTRHHAIICKLLLHSSVSLKFTRSEHEIVALWLTTSS